MRAVLRRMDTAGQLAAKLTGAIQRGALCIDPVARAVRLHGRPVTLTLREFDLLLFFAQHPGRVFNRMELLDQIWSYAHDGYEHTVNSHINRLRNKIESRPARPEFILTAWGMGYKFVDPEEGARSWTRSTAASPSYSPWCRSASAPCLAGFPTTRRKFTGTP